MNLFIRASALLAVLAGCPNDDNQLPIPTPSPTPATADPAGPTEKPESDDPPLKQHMQDHFSAIRAIERAVVSGDLATAKERATWLAEHQQHDAVDLWQPHLAALREAALALAGSSDLPGAASAAVKLGLECAACHVTTTAITSFPYEPEPSPGADNKSMMQRHQWAVDRMWEGLIGPSESSWNQGARVLADAPFIPRTELQPLQKKTVVELAGTVHDLGKQAKNETEQESRGRIYGELLTTCSGCHELTRR